MEVLAQNFNIVDLIKFLEKIKNFIFGQYSHIECNIMQNRETKSKENEKPRFYGQNKLFSQYYAILATWLHVGAPQKIQEK